MSAFGFRFQTISRHVFAPAVALLLVTPACGESPSEDESSNSSAPVKEEAPKTEQPLLEASSPPAAACKATDDAEDGRATVGWEPAPVGWEPDSAKSDAVGEAVAGGK